MTGSTMGDRFLRTITHPLNIHAAYLFGATAVSAAAGFFFWLLAARLTNSAQLGIAAAMISSVNLLKGFADLGLGSAIIYYAPENQERVSPLVNTLIVVNLLASSSIGLIFLLGLPIWSPGLIAIQSNLSIAALFLIFVVIDALLSVQDMAMLSRRNAGYVFWRTLACNVPTVLLLPLILILMPSFEGIFLAYIIPNMIVVTVSSCLILPRWFEGYRQFGQFDGDIFRTIWRYASANQIANMIWAIPNYALPLVVISLLSAEDAGHFAINWSIVNFVLIIPRVVSTSLFVEGAQRTTRLSKSILQALLVIGLTSTPMIIGLWLWGDVAMSVFGEGYHHPELMRLFLIGVLPFSMDTLYFTFLRIRDRSLELIIFSAFIVALILCSLFLFTPQWDLDGVALAWLLGYSAASLYVGSLALVHLQQEIRLPWNHGKRKPAHD